MCSIILNTKSALRFLATLFVYFLCTIVAIGQKSFENWHLKDLKEDGYYGISLKKAYDFLKGKKSKTVIVAVIDTGIDTTQEDLKGVLWTNPNEIPGNGVDDDNNGYIDDIHGWNFLGGRDGRSVIATLSEQERFYQTFKEKFNFNHLRNPSTLEKSDQLIYYRWLKAEGLVKSGQSSINLLRELYERALARDSFWRQLLNKEEYYIEEIESYKTQDESIRLAKRDFLSLVYTLPYWNGSDKSNKTVFTEAKDILKKLDRVNYLLEDPRSKIVNDDDQDINDRAYGNNLVMGFSSHGTHVAGIIGSIRDNNKGVNGIADNVWIMPILAVPSRDGDEHDKDVALAIRYAVDNGAKIINMSFAKRFSLYKTWVDDAVRYAETKGVLIVHAAGNHSVDLDFTEEFPHPVFLNDGNRASNWITVGASSDPALPSSYNGLVVDFSNYGLKEVDVFAPGDKINSTMPNNSYAMVSGTSMAAPIVSGIAALIWSYYPYLSAQQVKYVIEKSVVKPITKVKAPGSAKYVYFSELSRTGGIVNAYNAVKLASTLIKNKHFQ